MVGKRIRMNFPAIDKIKEFGISQRLELTLMSMSVMKSAKDCKTLLEKSGKDLYRQFIESGFIHKMVGEDNIMYKFSNDKKRMLYFENAGGNLNSGIIDW